MPRKRHSDAAILEKILHAIEELRRATPSQIEFQEVTMNPAVAGNTLVYTGTLSPSGSAFPAGTTFTVLSSNPNAVATVDSTGLVVTIVLGAAFVDDAAIPLTVSYSSSTFTPSPQSSPASITATITPTVPVAATPTPTGIEFAQTT